VGEALALRRGLAAGSPAHRPDLATSLSSLGIVLRDLGRRREALDAAREAVQIYRQLAAADPGLYQDEYRRLQAQLDRDLALYESSQAAPAAEEARDRRPPLSPDL